MSVFGDLMKVVDARRVKMKANGKEPAEDTTGNA